MNNEQISVIFDDLLGEVSGVRGKWKILVQGIHMICYTDELHDRFRIIAKISSTKTVTVKQLKDCMEANFHTMADVQYAISNHVLWAIYKHPLKELTEMRIKEAVRQLFNAVTTYGDAYSSGNINFPTQKDFLSGLN